LHPRAYQNARGEVVGRFTAVYMSNNVAECYIDPRMDIREMSLN